MWKVNSKVHIHNLYITIYVCMNWSPGILFILYLYRYVYTWSILHEIGRSGITLYICWMWNHMMWQWKLSMCEGLRTRGRFISVWERKLAILNQLANSRDSKVPSTFQKQHTVSKQSLENLRFSIFGLSICQSYWVALLNFSNQPLPQPPNNSSSLARRKLISAKESLM